MPIGGPCSQSSSALYTYSHSSRRQLMRVFLDLISPHPDQMWLQLWCNFSNQCLEPQKGEWSPLGHTHTLIFSRQISESDRTYVRTCTYKYVIDPTDRPPVAKSTTRSPLSLLIALCLHMWAVQTLTLTLNAHTRTHAQDMHVCVHIF